MKDFRRRKESWLYDHPKTKEGIDAVFIVFMSTISAIIFAIGFNVFMDPVVDGLEKIVSGGASGISQVIVLFLKVCGWEDVARPENIKNAYSILYFLINVPMIVLAWFGIGKRFTLYTLLNVVETSLFIGLFSPVDFEFFKHMAVYVNDNGYMIGRALFGGVCTGLSSAICFKVDISTGGIDVLSYYIALKKKTSVGKYTFLINGVTVCLFTLLECVDTNFDFEIAAHAVSRVLFTGIYLLVTMLVVDFIHVRNKKLKVEVITANPNLGKELIATIPHGATVLRGTGAYTGGDRYIVTMVVSSFELPDVQKAIRKVDPNAFTEVTALTQVFGRFYMKPVK